jgi:hypothetical protein
VALEAPAASSGPTADAPAPPPASEGREASLPQPVEAVEATVVAATTDVADAIVKEAGPSPPRPVAAETHDVRALGEPAAAAKE